MGVAKMNWQRATERDQGRRAKQDSAPGLDVSIKAKYAGVCATCSKPFNVGDRIASLFERGQRRYSHAACIYGPATDDKPPGDTSAAEAPDGRCHALTAKGLPCRGGAKKGERYCGPHLEQLAREPKPDPPRPTEPDPFDEPF